MTLPELANRVVLVLRGLAADQLADIAHRARL
jgi:hypothetical protein